MSPYEVIRLRLFNIFLSIVATIMIISTFWLIFITLTLMGCPFPQVDIEKFFDLGFLAFSMFSFIIFLTIAPFQTIATKLSPRFYARMLRNIWSHFSLYLLLTCSVVCFFVVGFYQTTSENGYSSQLYLAIIASIIIAILFHRVWALRYLHEAYIVYINIDKLIEKDSKEDVWMEMMECIYKAIRDARLSDSKNFIDLLFKLYDTNFETQKETTLREDLKCLYKATEGLRPISRYMETKWPFLLTAK
jgi:hypothetical protein